MTYEYLCTACRHAWEAEQSITAAPLTECPRCSRQTAKRQVSGGAGFILRGGGWYADGYGSKKPEAQGKAEASGGKPGGDKKAGDGPGEKPSSDKAAAGSDASKAASDASSASTPKKSKSAAA